MRSATSRLFTSGLAALLIALCALTVASPTPAVADGNEAAGGPLLFRSITSGNSHSCAILEDATVKCWGLANSGQLGTGNQQNRGDGANEMGSALARVDLGPGRTAVALTGGLGHTCAVLDNGLVKCWGHNGDGQLGLGDTAARGDGANEMGVALPAVPLGAGRTATAVSANGNTTCALLDNGSVKCWGSNTTGQLGQGNIDSQGDQPGEVEALTPIPLGSQRTATAISVGVGHACALLDDQSVKCWGSNAGGRLGIGVASGNFGDAPNELGDNLPPVNLGTGATAAAVSAGNGFNCAVLTTGTVKCWGLNSSGRLGIGNTTAKGGSAADMGDALQAVPLGAGLTAIGVTTGFDHACAALSNGGIKCWGSSASGQLGQGTTASLGDQANELGDNLPPIALGTGHTATALTTGNAFTCAVIENATVRCWGINTFGQLGLGTTTTIGEAPGEMGNALATTDLGVPVGPVAELSVALTADQTTVTAGEDIDYQLTISNAGGLPLTGITVSDVQAPDCEDPVANLAVGAAAVVIDCTYTTVVGDVGTYSNVATVDSAETNPVASSQVNVTVNPPPTPELTVALSADQTAVTVGESIDYHVTVTNTGDLPLTEISLTDNDVPDCEDPVPDLAVGAPAVVIDCSYTTTAADVGTFSNVVFADTAQTPVVGSGTVNVTVNAPDTFRSDGRIRVGAGALLGNDTYNTTGNGQALNARVRPRRTATFTVEVQNDGTAPDDFTLRGLGSTNRYNVSYRQGATNITAGVRAGTATLTDVPEGQTRIVTIRIQAKRNAPRGARVVRLLTITSAANGTQDTVKATVTRRR